MDRFHVVDDAAVIVRSRGVFRQAKVFRRGVGIYAGHGSGFIRLYKGGGTSQPNISWDDIEVPGLNEQIAADAHGKMELPFVPENTKTIEAK